MYRQNKPLRNACSSPWHVMLLQTAHRGEGGYRQLPDYHSTSGYAIERALPCFPIPFRGILFSSFALSVLN